VGNSRLVGCSPRVSWPRGPALQGRPRPFARQRLRMPNRRAAGPRLAPSPGRHATFSKAGGGVCPGLAAGPYRRSCAARPRRTSRKKPAIESHEESVHIEASGTWGALRPLTWVSYPRKLMADGELGIFDRSSLAVVSWVKRHQALRNGTDLSRKLQRWITWVGTHLVQFLVTRLMSVPFPGP
jgi:hypothetical protein